MTLLQTVETRQVYIGYTSSVLDLLSCAFLKFLKYRKEKRNKMDFGSKFVYIYPESEEETYSDTEFDSGFITSKSSRPSLPRPRPRPRSGGARSAHQMRPSLEVSRW